MSRHDIRIKAIQALYQLLGHEKAVTQADINVAIKNAYTSEDTEITEIPEYLTTLVSGVLEHEDTINATISENLDNWTLDKLNRIDSTILKLATYEILYVDDEETPSVVAIDEAVELAKTFSDDKSQGLINGVLQAVSNNNK